MRPRRTGLVLLSVPISKDHTVTLLAPFNACSTARICGKLSTVSALHVAKWLKLGKHCLPSKLFVRMKFRDQNSKTKENVRCQFGQAL